MSLYVVSTPIGNLEDITLRAIRTLKEVDLIAAEDTRHTGILLKHYGISKPQISYHEHNKVSRTSELVSKMLAGTSVALVSDAGTPGISDPGFRLIREAQKNNILVTVIPGPTALVCALLLSSCPVDQFQFLGFLSPKLGKKKEKLLPLRGYEKSVILYESPHRIVSTITVLQEVFGSIAVTLCRELTKMHEEVQCKTTAEWLVYFQEQSPRGEYVLVFVPGEAGGLGVEGDEEDFI